MLSDIRVTPSPHISYTLSTRRIMADVIIGLLFPLAAAGYYYRWYALTLTATCVITCLITELLCNIIRRIPRPASSLGDLSAVVTGMILAFSLPPAFPLWAAAIGSAFAIAIGKMVFGGLGSNIFNPAMAGRIFLTASFGIMMTTWTVPATIDPSMPLIGQTSPRIESMACYYEKQAIIARTQATPLAQSKEALKNKTGAKDLNGQMKAAFFGEVGGCLGETSALALLVGGAYLLLRKTISYHIPLAVIASAFIFGAIAWLINPDAYMSPVMHILTGGLLIGAFFIATDPVTAPLTKTGMLIFGAGVGAITMLVRIIGEYPEGVMYSVLLMNAVSPLIDRMIKPKPAGGVPNAK
ncbi:MAG: RnfABCDGE type electron transport complex subunit D, partial [Phycisphaerae bacterium]